MADRCPRPLPSLDRLQELFQPNFRQGELLRRKANRRGAAGTRAGSVSYDGRYQLVGIGGKTYLAHRILYAMYHKIDPGSDVQIDHKNGDGTDNCVDNLRAATPAQNRQNSKVSRLGLKGAYRSSTKTGKQWVSHINAHNERHYLGCFETEEEAHEAYAKASAEHHGKFGRVH